MVALVALLGAVRSANADCIAPPPVLWSYPDAATGTVPETARIWVLAASQLERYLTVTLDGERLQRVNATGTAPLERAEYAPLEPLALGEHELVIELREPSAEVPIERRRIPFVVAGADTREVRAELGAVTRYEWSGSLFNYSAAADFPPAAAYEGDCSDRVVDTAEGCYDILDEHLVFTRVELDSNGAAVAYLLGDLLVPGDCRVFFPWGRSEDELTLTPILPEGWLSGRTFTGEVEVIEGGPPPVDYAEPPGWCSLAYVGGASSAPRAALLGGLGLVGLLAARRRTAR